MADNEDNKKRRPLKNLPPESFQPKVILIWAAIIAAVVALFYFNPAKAPTPARVKIQQVVEFAEKGEVATGAIRQEGTGGSNWYEMTGELKQASLPSDTGQTKYFVASGRLTDANMERLQKTMAFEERSESSLGKALATSILPFVLVIGLLYFLFVRQLRQAGKGALSFGKSRAKLLTRDKDRITFADVAGCDEAKEEVSDVVDFL